MQDWGTPQGIQTLDGCKAACVATLRCYAISWADEGGAVTCKLKLATAGDPEVPTFTTYVKPLECCSTITIRHSSSAGADGMWADYEGDYAIDSALTLNYRPVYKKVSGGGGEGRI